MNAMSKHKRILVVVDRTISDARVVRPSVRAVVERHPDEVCVIAPILTTRLEWATNDDAAAIACPAPFGQWTRPHGGREYRGLRTRRYTYARDLNGPWLLFDNQADPAQLRNLVNHPGHAALQAKLEAALARRLKATGDDFLPAAYYIKKWGYTVDQNGTAPYDP